MLYNRFGSQPIISLDYILRREFILLKCKNTFKSLNENHKTVLYLGVFSPVGEIQENSL